MGFYWSATGGYYEGDRLGFDVEVPQRPSPAHIWDGSAWVPGPQIVPTIVTMRQARTALMQAGLLANVDGVIDGMPSPQKEAARIEWEYSQTVERNRPLVVQLGAALGLTVEGIDQLFITAATL